MACFSPGRRGDEQLARPMCLAMTSLDPSGGLGGSKGSRHCATDLLHSAREAAGLIPDGWGEGFLFHGGILIV